MSNTLQAPGSRVRRVPRGTASALAPLWRITGWLALVAMGLVAAAAQAKDPPANKHRKPNILFIIMDDVGMDQMRVFTYGGATPPQTPALDTLASAGIRFRNTWSMPACSTSRAVIFTGRFPLRTHVYGALGPSDLVNSQVSPYEMTLPKLLKQQAGYHNALFGKFHLGLQGKNPFQDDMPRALGWDYFYGWLDETGDPSSIDSTAGGVGPVDPRTGKGPYGCGFVPGAAHHPLGAESGACYAGDGSCRELQTADGNPPGRQCRDGGGILDPNQSCKPRMPANIREGFKNYSAHYVSPLVINDEQGQIVKVPARDIRARTYRGTAPVDAAIDWIQRQPKHQPWMATVSFATAHTPVMQPPQALIATDPRFGQDAARASQLTCVDGESNVDALSQRALTNLMIEAMDAEIGRLLASIGLARRAHDGTLKYNPHNNDTMIVIVGDNGTLGPSVKQPFDATRAKGTAYQTGVWVPLIVSGPLVKQPDRNVRHMVNIADLYQLFGEIAGIEDVPGSVPRQIDAMSMLPYLKHPDQDSIRQWNFTQVAPNLQKDLALNPPCVIRGSCTQIPVTEGVCTDNGGTWYAEFPTCCSLNQARIRLNLQPYNLQPLSSVAVRNDHYKVVRNRYSGQYDNTKPQYCGETTVDEFYAIDELPIKPLLDKQGKSLPQPGETLSAVQKRIKASLTARLDEILASQPPCPGDGNIDGVVNPKDERDWGRFAAVPQRQGFNSSWYDFNIDGLTNVADLDIIRSNLQTKCR